MKCRGIVLATCLAAMVMAGSAQTKVGGHVGTVFPLVTHAGGNTTTLNENFALGFPMGITVSGQGRTAFDLEFVPFVQDHPRKVTLLVHPGLIWRLGRGYSFGMRGAFEINSAMYGFTPLLNKGWAIKKPGFFKAYFVEAVLPVRFDRPTGGPSTNPVTFGMHFGAGF